MSRRKTFNILSMAAVMLSASAALAGTSVKGSLVPWSDVHPTMSAKGKVQVTDKGTIQVSLDSVTNSKGILVTTSTTYNDNAKANGNLLLDGQEYIVQATVEVSGFAAQVVTPVDLKAGKGKTKLDLSALLSLGSGQPLAIRSIDVWGPLGTALAACVASNQVSFLTSLACTAAGNPQACCTGPLMGTCTLPFVLNGVESLGGTPGDTSCLGGTHLGVMGLALP